MRYTILLIGLLGISGPHARAQQPGPFGKQPDVKIEGLVAFTEGPAWHSSGNVYFSDGLNNRILRRDRLGTIHTYRQPSGKANGLLFDRQGRLLACEGAGEGGNRRVTRTEADGTISVLADRFEGQRFNSPNDLALDSQNRIYFTDPRYGPRNDLEQFDATGRAVEGVYRIDPDGKVFRVLSHEVDRPNGILVSEQDRYLYVADNNNDPPRGQVPGARKLWRFDLRPDGNVDTASRKLLYDWGTDRGPDGLALDQKGRIYAAAGLNKPIPPGETADRHKAGVYVITPEGKLEAFLPIPEDSVTNCTFGDADLQTLFITAGHKLWSIRCDTPGLIAWPKRP